MPKCVFDLTTGIYISGALFDDLPHDPDTHVQIELPDWPDRELHRWDGATGIRELTHSERLVIGKERKSAEIIGDYARAMVSGFVSSALGAEHFYASDVLSQIKLAGATATDDDVEYECFARGMPEMKLHSAEQMKQVLRDGKNKAVEYKRHVTALIAQIQLASSIEEVDAVVW